MNCRRTNKSTFPAGARGVTVVEVMVALSIIVVLGGILLPAVVRVRETSRRNTCTNNLRQMGYAAHEVLATQEHFPDLREHLRTLLPYLDQQALYDELTSLDGRTGAYIIRPRGAVTTFVCPSDEYANVAQNDTNYRINTGAHLGGSNANGMVKGELVDRRHLVYRGVRPQEIPDGLGNTVLYGERLTQPDYFHVSGVPSRFDAYALSHEKRFAWWPDKGYGYRREDELANDCAVRENRVTAYLSSDTLDRAHQVGYGPVYNHVSVPNAMTCYVASAYQLPRLMLPHLSIASGTIPLTSNHDGGVNVTLADGSVRFVSSHIDRSTWRALGTRASSDDVGVF